MPTFTVVAVDEVTGLVTNKTASFVVNKITVTNPGPQSNTVGKPI